MFLLMSEWLDASKKQLYRLIDESPSIKEWWSDTIFIPLNRLPLIFFEREQWQRFAICTLGERYFMSTDGSFSINGMNLSILVDYSNIAHPLVRSTATYMTTMSIYDQIWCSFRCQLLSPGADFDCGKITRQMLVTTYGQEWKRNSAHDDSVHSRGFSCSISMLTSHVQTSWYNWGTTLPTFFDCHKLKAVELLLSCIFNRHRSKILVTKIA